MYVLKVNDIVVDLTSGFQVQDILNEVLDSSKLSISHTERLSLNILDKVSLSEQIKYNDTYLTKWEKNFLLSSYDEEQISYGDKKRYNYVITLVSPTLILENYIRPNMTITKDTINDNNTILKFFERILNSSKSLQQELRELLDKNDKDLIISDRLKERLSNVDILENQFNSGNLREIFNNILEQIGCVVKMDDYKTIDYLDLNAKGNEIDTSKLVIDSLNQSSDEYASHLKMQVENCLSDKVNYIEQYVGVRSDDALLTTDNAFIPTISAIYDIDKIYCYADVNFTISKDNSKIIESYGQHKLDITPFVIEKTIYDTTKVRNYSIENFNQIWIKDYKFDLEECMESRISHLYFIYNKKNIGGLNYSENYFSLIGNKSYAFEGILKAAYLYGLDKSIEFNQCSVNVISDVRDLVFEIRYKSSRNINLEFEKTNEYKNKRKLIDGQSNSFVDTNKLGVSMQEKINRIGNTNRRICGRYNEYSEIPKLGDYIDNYILTTRNMVFYPNEILFEGTLNKDFSVKNLATNLNQAIRFTSIDTSNNILLRNENIRMRCEINKSTGFASRNWNNFINYLLKNYGKSSTKLLYLLKTTSLTDSTESMKVYTSYGYFKINPSIQKVSNTIAISFNCDDNFSVGLRIDNENATGGYSQAKTRYVYDNGEFEYFKIFVYDNHSYDYLTDADKIKKEAQYFPLFPSEYILEDNKICEFKKQYNKDNREIFGFTIQLDFIGNDNIFVKDTFLDNIPLLLNEDTTDILPLQIYVSSDEIYSKDDTIAKGENLTNKAEIEINGNTLSLNGDIIEEIENALSWCITTKNSDKILIAVNGKETTLRFEFDLDV